MLRALFAAAAFALFAGFVAVSLGAAPAPKLASPTVEIRFEHGHGSGVHIGNGYIVTAEHVAHEGYYDHDARAQAVLVRDQGGGLQWGKVIWGSKELDVALIRIYKYDWIAAAKVSSKPLKVGDEVRMEGNPYDIPDLVTYGHVATEARPYKAYWSSAFFVNGEVRPGMSGGPCFDKDGNLVGINVGQEIEPMGFSTLVFPSIGMIVPVTAFADLLPH